MSRILFMFLFLLSKLFPAQEIVFIKTVVSATILIKLNINIILGLVKPSTSCRVTRPWVKHYLNIRAV